MPSPLPVPRPAEGPAPAHRRQGSLDGSRLASLVRGRDTDGRRRSAGPPPRRDRRCRPLSVLVRRRRRARQQPDAGAHRDVRPVHRRRRLHRVVDGDHRQGARPVARRRPDRRPRDRVGGQRSQRRLHGVQPHPRRRQRPGALPRRDCRCSKSSGWRTSTRSRRRSSATTSTATTSARASSTSPPRSTRRATSTSCATTTSSCARSARRSSGSTRRRCAPRSTRRPTRGGLWRKDRAALVDPARLVWGLKAAAMSLGVRIYEDTKATSHRQGRRRRAGHHAARPGPRRPRWRWPRTRSSRC